LFSFVDKIPKKTSGNAFIFSTVAITGKAKAYKNHAPIREKPVFKGYVFVNEFSCKGL